jgi:hypothetical protein
MIILKLDFEKAFDKIEHEVILQVMRHKCFSQKWLNWIKGILSSSTSSIFIKWNPRKDFSLQEGGGGEAR